jgi:hypothetical protein
LVAGNRLLVTAADGNLLVFEGKAWNAWWQEGTLSPNSTVGADHVLE